MLIYGEKVYIKGKGFKSGTVEVSDGKITAFHEGTDKNADMKVYYLLPGFIDIHTHGAAGGDMQHADMNELIGIRRYMVSHGVTSFVPTTVSESREHIITAIKNVLKTRDGSQEGANIIGINIEGPYFTEKHRGAHELKYLRKPDTEEFDEMLEASCGLLSMICVAPEYDNTEEFIKHVVSRGVRASVAHTDADYETVKKAFSWGATNVTHLYNAMSPLHHRMPGCVGAAFDSDVTAEIICDGLHVHPAAVMIAIREKGVDNMVLISDSLAPAGLPDGEYTLGFQKIFVKNGKATVAAGNLAGSTTNIHACFKNVISWGVRPEDAVKMASENPARVANAEGKGKIEVGADADFTVLDKEFELCKTIVGGKTVFE